VLSTALLLSPLFAPLCAPCHGPEGRGDGPAAALYTPRPADLARPTTFKLGSSTAALNRTLTTGLPGTGMPAFGALSPSERAALVAHVRGFEMQTTAVQLKPDPLWPPGHLAPQQHNDSSALARAPALGRLEAMACARCHPAIAREWQLSVHARAMGPGVVGQYVGRPTLRDGCDRCHAPLEEQRKDASLAAEGVTCAACHLRDGHKITGPQALRPLKAARGAQATRRARLGRSDVCLPCHTLPLSSAVNGRPLLDTWREWAASPYLPAGIQCQHCHMPGGDHQMRGVHDPQTVREAVRLTLSAHGVVDGSIRARVEVHNVGAGHHFPTTATPRAVIRVRQRGEDGPIEGTERLWAIGRTVRFEAGAWHEVADTRIRAGGGAGWCYDVARAPSATAIEVSLHMFPDWYYTTVYRRALRGPLPEQARAHYEAALSAGAAAAFLVSAVERPLPESTPPGAQPGDPATGPSGWPTCGVPRPSGAD
jgi:hypothetical protein